MSTIALYAGKINNMSSRISDTKKSVNNLKSDLFSLKNKLLSVNRNICNLDDVISSISSSTKLQEEKIYNLEKIAKNINNFVVDTVKIDAEAADIINNNKEKFYDEYYYLKPEQEKNCWDKICDGCQKACEWCKENWESIVNIALVVVAVIAIVAICVATFGAAAVAVSALVGAIVGVAGQFISDLISWKITGEWSGTWQSYLGAALGGAVGGILTLTGNPVAACMVDGALSTLFSESLENITGGEKRSMSDIWTNTILSSVISGVCSIAFNALSSKLSKLLAKNIPCLSRLSGKGSYSASFKGIVTKLKNKSIQHFTYKTVRNGVVSGLTGDIIKNIAYGFGLDDFIKDKAYELGFNNVVKNIGITIKLIDFLKIPS